MAKIWRMLEKVPRAIEFTSHANGFSMLGSNACISGLCKIKETQVNCIRFSIVHIQLSTNVWIRILFTREAPGHLNKFSFRNETYTCALYMYSRAHIMPSIPKQATWKTYARGFLFQFKNTGDTKFSWQLWQKACLGFCILYTTHYIFFSVSTLTAS